jgi:hypothetical protein
MKYVILNTVCDGDERVYYVIFPELLTHSIVAENMQRAVRKETGRFAMVFSAGFCQGFAGGILVTDHGSESLRIERNNDAGLRDENILNQPNAMQGMMPC